MSDAQPNQAQRALYHDFLRLASGRAESEARTATDYETSLARLEKDHRARKAAINAAADAELKAADKDHQDSRRIIQATFEAQSKHTQRAFDSERDSILEKARANEKTARDRLQEAIWLADTLFEAHQNQPQDRFDLAVKAFDADLDELKLVQERAAAFVRRCRLGKLLEHESLERPNEIVEPAQAAEQLRHAAEGAKAHALDLESLRIAKLFRGPGLAFLAVIFVGTVGAITLWVTGKRPSLWLAVNGGAAALVAAIVIGVLYAVAKSRSAALLHRLDAAAATGRVAYKVCVEQSGRQRDREEEELIDRRAAETKAAHEQYDPILAEIPRRRDHYLAKINEKYPRLLSELREKCDADLQAADESFHARTAAARRKREDDLHAADELEKRTRADIESQRESSWNALAAHWKEGMSRAHAGVESINRESAALFPAWSNPSWESWQPPTTFAPVLRFGEVEVDLSKAPGGLPNDPQLAVPGPARFPLPAALEFPDRCSLLIESGAEGRAQALQTLQTVMLRLLTALPPGKVRFTIIDPIGLGQSFAGFMHLADYDEAFVGGKIWTEARHIEQRLTDLTEHMENVIQKYLRNEFSTIAEYNEQAGEIAEPYRFLVISDFPVNFDENAARRLASVINSGPRCGVFTLIAADPRAPMPTGISMADLRQGATVLAHEGGRFVWKDADYRALPLTLDPPPSEEFITRALHIVGRAALDSSRVEVPFEVIAPEPSRRWSLSSGDDLVVPIGRAGATKLQHLALGRGTAQHALIAGKTGSGKSTLLHVLITNLALWYSPDEVEFYLIDFKKGVEFKTYSTHELPHARAVAIESDREFGLSVLQRLDRELAHRGNVYRELGVQDLAGYRRAAADGAPLAQTPMPRTLLIIDEFQEIFTEDDKLAQDSALLMDRLVRQGRAFGIHVILGSQTLGGAYTLARSTIGQMAVRIALQCSEADSYLILSDDNSAARLLSRPGEAIYNDASGIVEGNSPFQIVWLNDDRREAYLEGIADLARGRGCERREPLIVFEGNVPGDIARNHLLEELLRRPSWPDPAPSRRAWLGDAVAIKEPTAAVFRRHSGNNLIMIGQREEAALAMMATSLISLAAQIAPTTGDAARGCPPFFILDGTPADSPDAGLLGRIAAMLPHQTNVVAWRDVAAALGVMSEELARRQQGHGHDEPPVFLFIYGLQRFRMLRQETDFSFSTMTDDSKPASADKLFAELLREGPALGLHTIAWCDTMNNVNRALDRQGLREFEFRVLFQMSPADSSNLIDSPIASALGLKRALFYSEEHGSLEKFRPYAMPEDAWLAHVKSSLARRGAREDAPKRLNAQDRRTNGATR